MSGRKTLREHEDEERVMRRQQVRELVKRVDAYKAENEDLTTECRRQQKLIERMRDTLDHMELAGRRAAERRQSGR